ncbi:undecaprenyl-diphosphatase [Amycolatopsis arida]|uniref:Undecaprenyl-diphosphatase n=1 Tax=Amycolatopsis arida TaxID=587909 RepID=A0A1I5Y0D9_9PSEU|nr:phosphatase PAP2 family protein [Amycolatopsis arida]TDX97169.1 undecaprenyl-diphosphatase [Amycolatopsis arida]SFQ37653.1 undecaprenyl-diphosphatase [Amycolatopsis arida]
MSGRARVAVTGSVLVAAFVLLGVLVHAGHGGVDAAVEDLVGTRWTGPLGRAAELAGAVLGPVLPTLLGVVLLAGAALLWRRGEHRTAGLLIRVAVVLAVCRATSVVFKPVFDRQRPRVYPEASFPSGHVVSVAGAGFALVVLCAWLAPRLLRRMVALAVVATALAAAARIALGVHWLTDTIGAVLAVIGFGLLTCAGLGLLPAGRDRVSVGPRDD